MIEGVIGPEIFQFSKDIIPYIIQFFQEKAARKEKVSVTEFQDWLRSQNEELANDIRSMKYNMVITKAFLHESEASLRQIMKEQSSIRDFLEKSFDQVNHKLDMLLDQSTKNSDSQEKFRELIECLFENQEHLGLYDDQLLDMAIKRIDELKSYQAEEKHPLTSDSENELFNTMIAGGYLKEGLSYIRSRDVEGDIPKARKFYHEGQVHYLLSDYIRARESFGQAVQLDPQNPRYHRRMGQILYDLSEFNAAKAFLTKALELCEDDAEKGHILHALGRVFEVYKRTEQAMTCYEQALALTESSGGVQSKHYSSTLNNIAHLNNKMGNYDLALKQLREVLCIDRAINGEKDGFENGITFNNMGGVYFCTNQYGLALEHFMRALEIFKQELHENNFMIAITKMNVALSLSHLNRNDEAIELYLQADEQLMLLFDETHHDVSNLRNNLSQSLYHAGRIDEAIFYMKSALSGAIKNFGELDSETRRIKEYLDLMIAGKF